MDKHISWRAMLPVLGLIISLSCSLNLWAGDDSGSLSSLPTIIHEGQVGADNPAANDGHTRSGIHSNSPNASLLDILDICEQ